MPKNRPVGNCEAVAKDTIWQRLSKQYAPLAGASLFSCLLSLLTVWFTFGVIGPWICALGFALVLGLLGLAPRRYTKLTIPFVLASCAILLIVFGGGFSGPTACAILWPVLAMAGLQGQSTGKAFDWIATGIGASFAALLVVALMGTFIEIQTYDAIKAQSGILAFGVCGALTIAAVMARKTPPHDDKNPVLIEANRRRDAALLEAQAARDQNQERAQFMAEMSHEIRTPLNAILGFADTMRAQVFGPLPKPYGDYPDLIHKSGSHLLEVVSDLLDLSKIEAGRFQTSLKPVSLDELAREGVALSSGDARSLGISLRAEGEEIVTVISDARALRQIIFNLVSNAIKFTPAGGHVTIRATADRTAGLGRLEVEDNGVGMTPAVLARIGQPWNQANDAAAADSQRTRSSGLGLALVKRLAELQNGNLALKSTLGVGTKAVVTLPLAPQATVTPQV